MDLLGCVYPRGTVTSQLLDLPCPFTAGQDLFPHCLCCQVQLTSWSSPGIVLVAKIFISCTTVNKAGGSVEGKIQLSLAWL